MEVPWKYIGIADRIREEIKAGKRQASDLVSIKYLTQEHDVARQTAAKALNLLAREGLLQRFPGIGYIVVPLSHSCRALIRIGQVSAVARMRRHRHRRQSRPGERRHGRCPPWWPRR